MAGWIGLTVPNAEAVRATYEHVTCWTASPVSIPAGGGNPVAGVCYGLGENGALRAAGLIYTTVADLDENVPSCAERDGKVRVAKKHIAGAGAAE